MFQKREKGRGGSYAGYGKRRLSLVCANTLKKKKTGRLAQEPGADIVSCRLHDSTDRQYVHQYSKHMVFRYISLSSGSSCGIFLVSFLVAVAEIECLL